MIERQTYSTLEWLGDVGGLYDMLCLLGRNLISPFATFALNAELLTQAFLFASSLVYAEERKRDQ